MHRAGRDTGAPQEENPRQARAENKRSEKTNTPPPRILVEPGNPFGLDPDAFAGLLETVREELSPDYDVRVAYREQVGAGVSLYEVVNFWMSWQGWSTAAQSYVFMKIADKIVDKTLGWHKKRREAHPDAAFRPIWVQVIVDAGGAREVVREARIREPGADAEYGPFSGDEGGQEGVREEPPPVRPWPPGREDLTQRPDRERANRRSMLEGIHAVVAEAQRQGRGVVAFDSTVIAGIGKGIGLNATEARGLFKRLVKGNYVTLTGPLEDDAGSGELRAEVEYLSDEGLREIGEL